MRPPGMLSLGVYQRAEDQPAVVTSLTPATTDGTIAGQLQRMASCTAIISRSWSTPTAANRTPGPQPWPRCQQTRCGC